MKNTIEITITPKDPQSFSELGVYFKGYENGARMGAEVAKAILLKHNGARSLAKRRKI